MCQRQVFQALTANVNVLSSHPIYCQNVENLENMDNMDNLDIHTVLHCIIPGPREKCGCNRLQSGKRDVKDKKYVVDADNRKAEAIDKCM